MSQVKALSAQDTPFARPKALHTSSRPFITRNYTHPEDHAGNRTTFRASGSWQQRPAVQLPQVGRAATEAQRKQPRRRRPGRFETRTRVTSSQSAARAKGDQGKRRGGVHRNPSPDLSAPRQRLTLPRPRSLPFQASRDGRRCSRRHLPRGRSPSETSHKIAPTSSNDAG